MNCHVDVQMDKNGSFLISFI